MSAGTPGPWWVKEGSCTVCATVDGKDETVAHVDGLGEQLFADLALVSAAPELLEALRLLVMWYPNHKGGSIPALNAARAAIAKAEGR